LTKVTIYKNGYENNRFTIHRLLYVCMPSKAQFSQLRIGNFCDTNSSSKFWLVQTFINSLIQFMMYLVFLEPRFFV